jgi:hypothetical protein
MNPHHLNLNRNLNPFAPPRSAGLRIGQSASHRPSASFKVQSSTLNVQGSAIRPSDFLRTSAFELRSSAFHPCSSVSIRGYQPPSVSSVSSCSIPSLVLPLSLSRLCGSIFRPLDLFKVQSSTFKVQGSAFRPSDFLRTSAFELRSSAFHPCSSVSIRGSFAYRLPPRRPSHRPTRPFKVQSSRFKVRGSRFKVSTCSSDILISKFESPSPFGFRFSFGFRISNFGFQLPPSAFRAPRSAFRAPRSAFRAPRSAFRVPRSAFRVPRSAFRVLP